MTDAFLRYLLLLSEIPASPRRVDTCTLAERLANHGIRVTRRTLQRDLERLSRRLPLGCHDESKPYGWSWVGPTAATPATGETLRDVATRAAAHLAELRD